MAGKLVLCRHGQSEWNLENKFTGWEDVGLTPLGEEEALEAGKQLKAIDINFDIAFTSLLKRANKTLFSILEQMDLTWIPITHAWELNERHYGALQGKNKAEVAKEFGDEQVHIWRRSYDIPPPGGESLKDTADRVIPYLNEKILPEVYSGKNIIVSAHGNSIRAIVMALKEFTPEEILKTEIGWCEPWIFEFENEKLANLEIKARPNSKSMSKLPN